MSAHVQSTVAQSKRFTLNQIASEPGSSQRQFALTIDDAFTVTFIENGPDVLVANDITAHKNAVTQHSNGPYLSIAANLSIPEAAIELLESETDMRFEGTRDVSNPFTTNDTEPSTSSTMTLADAM